MASTEKLSKTEFLITHIAIRQLLNLSDHGVVTLGNNRKFLIGLSGKSKYITSKQRERFSQIFVELLDKERINFEKVNESYNPPYLREIRRKKKNSKNYMEPPPLLEVSDFEKDFSLDDDLDFD